MSISISNFLNPESIAPTGSMEITSMMKYTTDSIYYKIDTVTADSNFIAEPGSIESSKMVVTSLTNDLSTSATNQAYQLEYTSTHKIFKGGFIKINIPTEFSFSSASSAIAQFSIMLDGTNYGSIFSIDEGQMEIIGMSSREMPANSKFQIKIGGIRNPRYQLINTANNPQYHFRIRTYDTNFKPSDANPDATNLVDQGTGGYIDIDNVSPIESFGAEAFNTTNGAPSKYFLSWFSNIETKDGDRIVINFPVETELVPTNGNSLTCQGLNGINSVKCNAFDSILEVILEDVTQSTGLYKISAENVRNPPSLRGSSKFRYFYQTTPQRQKISEFYQDAFIENDFASELQDLNSDSIAQTSQEYGVSSDYTITFKPYSIVRENPVSLLLSYPVTVVPDEYAITKGCTVVSGTKRSKETDCKKIDGARLFKISNAYTPGWEGEVKIVIKLLNPPTNWGKIGFKIKTFEVVGEEEFIVDMLEGNELIPNLKCKPPCYQCQQDGDVVVDKDYCTDCWQDNALKYLMTYKSWARGDPEAIATCKSNCDDGFTSNGQPEFKCSKCDESCATCFDNNEVGDAKKCKTCSESHRFMYSPLSQCMQECTVGFYQVNDNTCDACADPCKDCGGDKFNCTLCHPEGEAPALFVGTQKQGDTEITRGTCYKTCPNGYFFDQSNALDIRCGKCASPCGTCVDQEDKCMSCNGDNNMTYVWDFGCYDQCPIKTAPDMSTLRCLACEDHCNQCGTETGSCYECERPYLLEMGYCVQECTLEGYRANKAGTHCINKTEFPILGPFFSVISAVLVITVLIAKKLKKETEVIPSWIGLISVLEALAILFQVYLSFIFEGYKYLAFSTVALVVLIATNIFNFFYVKNSVMSPDATKKEKLKKKKVKEIIDTLMKKQKRAQNYADRQSKIQSKREHVERKKEKSKQQLNENSEEEKEGGEIEMQYINMYSDIGESISQRGAQSDYSSDDLEFEGGGKKFYEKLGITEEALDRYLQQEGIVREGEDFYQYKLIEDKGFNKWVQAQDQTFKVIKWASLFFSFKVYRMTWSYFMGRKQFLILFQKKKFKKMTVVLTLLTQFLCELPIIICDVVAILELPMGEQLILTMIDTLAISVFLIVLEFYEIARLDTIMKTANTTGHKSRKSSAACESSEEEDIEISDSDTEGAEEDNYPDWRQMLKNVEGNTNLFRQHELQLKLNELDMAFGLRQAESCCNFNTGTEKEEDDRIVRSFPPSPRMLENFQGIDFEHFGKTFDNVYAESRDPRLRGDGKEYSEMGT